MSASVQGYSFLSYAVFMLLIAITIWVAYDIRMYAIRNVWFGIHEFDPWFNYRATRYLARHGLKEFFQWYDHRSWYPIGRPVGTTIYPGLQIVAVFLWRALNKLGFNINIYTVCVYMPAVFGSVASVLVGLLTSEATDSLMAGGISALVMAYIPAHTMRSIGGGFDNESLAVTMLAATFYCWLRSLRTDKSWYWGFLTAIAYTGMAATWGGYVFVVNMIGIHAIVLILLGYYSTGLHRAYSLWYIFGTMGATMVPVIGWTPLKSLEQVGPMGVFFLLQILWVWDYQCKSRNLTRWEDKQEVLIRTFTYVAVSGAVVGIYLFSIDFFGPISVRVRSLFVKHSLTGNPLVDSVAEHQPTNPEVLRQYMGPIYPLLPFGIILCFFNRTAGKIFFVLYAFLSYYFAHKMIRLIILGGPAASALVGISATAAWVYVASQVRVFLAALKEHGAEGADGDDNESDGDAAAAAAAASSSGTPKGKKAKKRAVKISKSSSKYGNATLQATVMARFESVRETFMVGYNSKFGAVVRFLVVVFIVYQTTVIAPQFYVQSHEFAMRFSNPQIVAHARLNTGEQVLVDDYLKAYEWLKTSTPKDARVLSWWDYGYQISGVGQRITLADGNTWNLEHIALIGKILTSPQKEAHDIAKHLADYVLVWAGGGADDLAKSPHIARIASSVFSGICGKNDPLCRGFGFMQGKNGERIPSESMRKSLLYNLVASGRERDAVVDTEYYEEVFTSKHRLCRIYKIKHVSAVSKAWAFNVTNRICDAPGSWYCVGQYPPAVKPPPKTHKGIEYGNDDARGSFMGRH
eukprot:TRINITY_DN10747_c0_g1_i1.p1 TRINITY_DN10747_c0_g1~~TRINITY_DN10747_c0_g1_i1.p1  ORF type:complete len:804 (+),score=230.66 TRINITY_DN10747_c0_g1_i1:125-2536(+)